MRVRTIVAASLMGVVLAGTGAAAGSRAPAASEASGSFIAGSADSLRRTGDGLLAVGQPAPDFTLADANGREVRLSALRGKPLVLYFYPMDETPGCTKEACAFRDDAGRYDSLGIRVLGVSTDDPRSHRIFAAKHQLPFTLLADTLGTVVRLYGTGVEVDQGGRKRWIANRVTYLIDAEGNIRQVWPRVNPVGHSEEILSAWQGLVRPRN